MSAFSLQLAVGSFACGGRLVKQGGKMVTLRIAEYFFRCRYETLAGAGAEGAARLWLLYVHSPGMPEPSREM